MLPLAMFHACHGGPERLLSSAVLVAAAGIRLTCWRVFVHVNSSAEDLKPETMAEKKYEDRKLEQG
jgi:hypothetical protein